MIIFTDKEMKDLINSLIKVKKDNLIFIEKEFHISHLIYFCLLENKVFYSEEIKNFIDWGTPEEWENYKKDFKTIFLDIDGTIFYNSGEFSNPKWGETDPIEENLEIIKKLYKTGKTQIILTTARKSKYKVITEKQLQKFNVPYDNIIFDLFHAKRFLINDYSSTNPYPTAIALNIKRDEKNLSNILF